MTLEYRASRNRMAAYGRKVRASAKPDPTETAKVNSMVSEMAWVIDWLRIGHQPGLSRGIDRRGAYQSNRHVVLDEDLFPSLQEPPRAIVNLSEDQRIEALAAIRALSPRELQCLMLNVVDGMSEYAIAKKLNISRSTVQTSLRRAKQKVPGTQ